MLSQTATMAATHFVVYPSQLKRSREADSTVEYERRNAHEQAREQGERSAPVKKSDFG
jgi:hypothetical protein